MTAEAPLGVLVMAYGGPASLEEIPGYLADIRSGRPTPRAVVERDVLAFLEALAARALLRFDARC